MRVMMQADGDPAIGGIDVQLVPDGLDARPDGRMRAKDGDGIVPDERKRIRCEFG